MADCAGGEGKEAAERLLDIIDAQPRLAYAPVGVGPFNSFSQRKAELDAKMPEGTEPVGAA